MSMSSTSDLRTSESLRDHLLNERNAMAGYGLDLGLTVPPQLLEALSNIGTQSLSGLNGTDREKGEVPDGKGVEDPRAVVSSRYRPDEVQTLASIHRVLADIVAPATPRTVLLLANEELNRGFWSFLGPMQLIRHMMIVAILSLVGLILTSLSPQVNSESINAGIFESSGITLLLNLLLLLSAAGLGGCFAGLFQANRYIANGSFDPRYESSYWIRIVLGLMAGIILAQLISFDLKGGQVLIKPTLATLGGFSAALVYRVLTRLVETVESLIRGDPREMMAAMEQAANARVKEQLSESRLTLASKITRIQQKIGTGASTDETGLELDRILNELIPDEGRLLTTDSTQGTPK